MDVPTTKLKDLVQKGVSTKHCSSDKSRRLDRISLSRTKILSILLEDQLTSDGQEHWGAAEDKPLLQIKRQYKLHVSDSAGVTVFLPSSQDKQKVEKTESTALRQAKFFALRATP